METFLKLVAAWTIFNLLSCVCGSEIHGSHIVTHMIQDAEGKAFIRIRQSSAPSSKLFLLQSHSLASKNRVPAFVNVTGLVRAINWEMSELADKINSLRNTMDKLLENHKPEPAVEPEPTMPDNCETNPCLNGGNCVDKQDGYICECQDGWEGVNCESNKGGCATNPCRNGRCVDKLDGYICKCYPNWEGVTCSSRMKPVKFTELRLIDIHGEETDGKESWGLVQVLVNGTWGTVCDNMMENHVALKNVGDVICRHLGNPNGGKVKRFQYRWGKKWLKSAELDLKNAPIWLNNIECTGKEASLDKCGNVPAKLSHCETHRQDVYLQCD